MQESLPPRNLPVPYELKLKGAILPIAILVPAGPFLIHANAPAPRVNGADSIPAIVHRRLDLALCIKLESAFEKGGRYLLPQSPQSTNAALVGFELTLKVRLRQQIVAWVGDVPILSDNTFPRLRGEWIGVASPSTGVSSA